MKIITKRANGTTRSQICFKEAKDLTDQSYKKSSDINNIMKQYQKTGLLLEPNKAFAKYQDNTLAIPLETAHELVNEARALFYELPSQLRKQMDNDPLKLEDFLSNPENHDQLIKYGLITKKADEVTTSPQPSADIPEPEKT